VKPRLKDVVWERDGAELRVVYDIRDHLMLSVRIRRWRLCWSRCEKVARHSTGGGSVASA
jgi:hypothetical protein